LPRINHLADVCDLATEVIVVGNRNDIVLYRDLKAAGVAEYFFKPLVGSLVTRTISGIVSGTRIQQPSRTGRLVFLLGVRGGVGATTIATNLAWYLAESRERRVLLLDLDLQNGAADLSLTVTPEMATCIYTTVLTDTGGFCYGATRASTFALAQALTQAGADPVRIAQDVYFSTATSKLLLLGAALSNLNREGRLAWLWISHQDMVRTCAATCAGSTRTIFASAPPTRSAWSVAPRCPSITAMTRPDASAAVNVSGGSRRPCPTWYPP